MLRNPGSTVEVARFPELLYEITVEQVMTRQVVTVSPLDTMRAVKELLQVLHLSGAPVVQEGRVVGIVTVLDVLKWLAQQDGVLLPAGQRLQGR